MPQGRFFRIGLGILLPLVIVYLLTKISFLFTPVLVAAQTLAPPLLLSGFVYYMLRPLTRYLERHGMRTSHATLLIYFVVVTVALLAVMLMGPLLAGQAEKFSQNMPDLLNALREQLDTLDGNRWLPVQLPGRIDLAAKIEELVSSSLESAINYISGLLGFLTSAIIIVSAIPIIVYYLLTEGNKARDSFMLLFPLRYRDRLSAMLLEMDEAMSGFLSGRLLICLLIGIAFFLGFWAIGLPYPLLLATFAMILNLIPFIGPIIGMIPSFIMAFTLSWGMVVSVGVLFAVVKIADNNLLSPLFLGKRMDLHPITVVLLLLVSGEAAGILGMLVSIPLYMILKILIRHLLGTRTETAEDIIHREEKNQ